MTDQLPTEILPADRRLTAAEFQGLADVPPEIEWYVNLGPAATKRAYKTAIGDFMRFTSISSMASEVDRANAWAIGCCVGLSCRETFRERPRSYVGEDERPVAISAPSCRMWIGAITVRDRSLDESKHMG